MSTKQALPPTPITAGDRHVALNQEGAAATAPATLSLCMDFPAVADDGHALPDTLQILPAGPDIQGRDGRGWKLADLDELIQAQNALGDIPIDWEHATEIAAPKGQPAPAAAWLGGWHACNGALCAAVRWTPKGAKAVRNREHRYLSPAFLHAKDGAIIRVVSVGLTNRPNLDLAALNRAATPNAPPEEHPMKLPAALVTALGIAEDADETTACNAVASLNQQLATAKEAAPSLDLFVPRGDYEAALNRATVAEEAVAKQAADALEVDIVSAVDAAQAAGKITPATRDYHLAQCRQEGGLERFEKFVTAAVPVVGKSGAEGKPPAAGDEPLTAGQLAAGSQLGIKSTEDYSKSLATINGHQENAA